MRRLEGDDPDSLKYYIRFCSHLSWAGSVLVQPQVYLLYIDAKLRLVCYRYFRLDPALELLFSPRFPLLFAPSVHGLIRCRLELPELHHPKAV